MHFLLVFVKMVSDEVVLSGGAAPMACSYPGNDLAGMCLHDRCGVGVHLSCLGRLHSHVTVTISKISR